MSNAPTWPPGEDPPGHSRPPTPPDDALARDRLVHQLNAAEPGGFVVVAAPAGWGKTTVVSQWAHQRDSPTLWFDCVRTPQDPERFWYAIRDALLDEVGPEATPGPHSSLTIERARPRHALEPLTSTPVDVAVVLDDFHLVTDAGIREDVTALATQLPARLTLVLVTRADPLMALHRARLSGDVVEIRARDLAFTSYETRRLLEAHDVTLSNNDIERLSNRMEGWATGLRLALSAFDSEPGTTAIVDAVVRASPMVAGYLIEQVLDRLDADDRDLLTTLSVVDRFDVALAEHLAATGIARSRLERLASVEGFLTVDDTERFPFRIHGVLRTVLRDNLRGTDAATYRVISARAAKWYRSAHMIEAATECAVDAHEWDLAADLLVDLATLGIAAGRPTMVALHLERFSAAWETIDPRIMLADVMLSLSRGDAEGSAVRLAMAEDGIRRLSGTSLVRAELLMRLLMAWVQQFRGDAHNVLAALGPEEGYIAIDGAPSTPIDDARRAIAQVHRAYAELNLGHLTEAEQAIAAALQATQDRYDMVRLRAKQLDAAVAAARGDIREALSRGRDTVLLAGECGPQLTFDTSMAHAVTAWALLEQGDLAGAQGELEQAQGFGPMRHFTPPVGYLIDGVQARLSAASGADPRDVLDAIRNATERRPSTQYPYLFRIVRLTTTVHALMTMGRHHEALEVIDSGPIAEHSDNARLARATVLARAVIYDPSTIDADGLGEVRSCVSSIEAQPLENAYSGWSVRLLLAAAIVESHADEVDRSAQLLHVALAETHRRGWRLPYLELGNSIVGLLSRERLRISAHNDLIAALLNEIRPRVDDDPAELVVSLSKREIEILRVLPTTDDQDELARRLYISKNTLKTHLRAIYRKLGVESRRQAVIKGERLRLL